MSKTKPELLEEATKLKLDVSDKNTIAEINDAIKSAKQTKKDEDKEVIAHREASVAKAGKRSEKSLKEVAEKVAKEARKEAGDTA
ncbi:50S ribosomal protein L1, partial [Candidatus Saccharibacteria bacterium]|nr:50S ribosomal protein L1 [Candidatus Saccharibacteria bacterium]